MSEFFTGDAKSESRYWKQFQRLLRNKPNAMRLRGDQMYVERLRPLEMRVGSIIIADAQTHKETMHDRAMQLGLVLMTGPGTIDERGDTVAVDCKVGDVVLLPRNVYWYSTFGHLKNYKSDTITRIRDAEIPHIYEDYVGAFNELNADVDGGGTLHVAEEFKLPTLPEEKMPTSGKRAEEYWEHG